MAAWGHLPPTWSAPGSHLTTGLVRKPTTRASGTIDRNKRRQLRVALAAGVLGVAPRLDTLELDARQQPRPLCPEGRGCARRDRAGVSLTRPKSPKNPVGASQKVRKRFQG